MKWLRSGPIVVQMGAISATTVVQRTDTVLRFCRCENMFLVLMLLYDKDSCQSLAAELLSYHIWVPKVATFDEFQQHCILVNIYK
jgi:hypothetical protein